MKDKKKNVFDTFLEKYDEYSSRKHVELEEYYRPSKAKCIFGFVFCLIFFLIILRLFTFSIVYFVIFFGVLICLLYYGINLFTKKGFVFKKKYRVPEEYLKQYNEEEYNNLSLDEDMNIEDKDEEDN